MIEYACRVLNDVAAPERVCQGEPEPIGMSGWVLILDQAAIGHDDTVGVLSSPRVAAFAAPGSKAAVG